MTQPKAGEWWQATDGEIVFIIGVKLNGDVMYQGQLSRDGNGGLNWKDWQHLPDCTGFDWKPAKTTRTVTLRRWIAWVKVGSEVELWRASEPIGWNHCHDTGETKTVEVPNE
jgi:hypothetical protein